MITAYTKMNKNRRYIIQMDILKNMKTKMKQSWKYED